MKSGKMAALQNGDKQYGIHRCQAVMSYPQKMARSSSTKQTAADEIVLGIGK